MALQMLVSVALAIALGAALGEISWAAYPLKEIGMIFINLLKMVVVPIAFVSITGAIIRLGNGKSIRGVTARAAVYMTVLSMVGVAVGFAVMQAIGVPAFDIGEAAAKEAKAPAVLEFIVKCIPVNPVAAFAEGNMLQVITFSFFVGTAALYLPAKEQISRVFDVLQGLCLTVTGFVIRIAPVGVFALLYPVAAKSFTHVVTGYLAMIGALVLGSVLYMAFVSYFTLRLSGVSKPWDFLKIILPGDIVGAISGGASNYMAPRIEILKEKTAITEEVIDYLVPLTSVLMRAGSCICVGIYTTFAASVYGVELTPEKIAVTVALAVIALTAAPGIIGGTLMDCAIIWAAIGIPLEAIAILAGIDYVMDVLRTVLNIQGGEVVTACVDAQERKTYAEL